MSTSPNANLPSFSLYLFFCAVQLFLVTFFFLDDQRDLGSMTMEKLMVRRLRHVKLRLLSGDLYDVQSSCAKGKRCVALSIHLAVAS